MVRNPLRYCGPDPSGDPSSSLANLAHQLAENSLHALQYFELVDQNIYNTQIRTVSIRLRALVPDKSGDE